MPIFSQIKSRVKLIIILLPVIAGLIIWWQWPNSPADRQEEQNRPAGSAGTGQPEGSVLLKGEMVCLPHKVTGGPQTLECAIGLKSDDGNFYALSDSDPEYKNVSGVGMGSRVAVKGSFSPREDAVYPTIGIITVSSLEKI